MFGKFFKRSPKSGTRSTTQATVDATKLHTEAAASALAKEQALAQADSFAGDEAAAADFILQCTHADARLKAAQHVSSQPQLSRVANAMRNIDRRVVKLMQRRLDALQMQDANEKKGVQCVQLAQGLSDQTHVLPSQVVELDRAWQAIPKLSPELRQQFDDVRSQIQRRLDAQIGMQRSLIDANNRLQQWIGALQAAENPSEAPPEVHDLDNLETFIRQCGGAPEAASLPQNLLPEVQAKIDIARKMLLELDRRQSAIDARMLALETWEASAPDLLSLDELKREWQSLPAVNSIEGEMLEHRFSVLATRLKPAARTKTPAAAIAKHADGKPMRDVSGMDLQSFTATLESMEQALKDGALQQAIESEKSLRTADLDSLRLTPQQHVRLTALRAELSRLQGWARWGSNVSREEMLSAAEDLLTHLPPIAELAKRIGSLRAHWKWLDQSTGSAGKELWLRFDAACTAAYAPVGEHYRALAEGRARNLEAARALIAEAGEIAEAYRASSASSDIDWKTLATQCARLAQQWRQLGPIERAERKSADAEFAAALRLISDPLEARQKVEIEARRQMIEQAAALNPADRNSIDSMRGIQQRWQEHAKSFPFERREEQSLWQQFRAVCDAFFKQRQAISSAADSGRLQQLREKEEICGMLESAIDEPIDELIRIMQQAKEAWSKAGHVPRQAESQIKARFDAAQQALESKLELARHTSSAKNVDALCEKLALCLALENNFVHQGDGGEVDHGRIQELWQHMPLTFVSFEKALFSRLNGLVAAARSGERQYASLLVQNQAFFMQDLLSLEILAEMDSPPGLSRERLKLQVQMLQSSLKAKHEVKHKERLLQICEVPALADEKSQERLNRLIRHFFSEVQPVCKF